MGESIVRWAVTLLAGLLLQAGLVAQEQIHIASEDWDNYTQADGQGLAWDILRMVYEPLGITVVIHSVPHTRAAGLAKRGIVDAFAGSYRNEVRSGIYYPEMHYDQDLVGALSLQDVATPALDSLKGFRLAWRHGYQLQRYLPAGEVYREISKSSNILCMLEMRHADLYLDDVSELEHVLALAEDRSRYKVTPLMMLPVYPGFVDSPHGKRLAGLYDERMKALVASGSLRPVFQRWKQVYPFE